MKTRKPSIKTRWHKKTRKRFRFLLRNSRDMQKMMGAGCSTGVVWWQRHLFQPWLRELVELFCCLYESIFLKHENLSWRCGKRMNIAFHSQRVYYSTVFKEAWFWINPNSYHSCLQNSLWDWVGWSLVGSSGHWVGCASSWRSTKPVNITGGGPCRGCWSVSWSHHTVSRLSRGCTHLLW